MTYKEEIDALVAGATLEPATVAERDMWRDRAEKAERALKTFSGPCRHQGYQCGNCGYFICLTTYCINSDHRCPPLYRTSIVQPADKAEAERDALIGAAYEAAANNAADRCAACGVREISGLVKEHIMRMVPSDATAALATVRAEARKAGMLAAAGIVKHGSEILGQRMRDATVKKEKHDWQSMLFAAVDIEQAIIAAAEKGPPT